MDKKLDNLSLVGFSLIIGGGVANIFDRVFSLALFPMNFDFTEEQTLLDNMVTSFVRDNYDWDTRCNIVKSEEGWKEENWKN